MGSVETKLGKGLQLNQGGFENALGCMTPFVATLSLPLGLFILITVKLLQIR